MPMLATVQGSIVALSTPAGRIGQFFEWWEHGGDNWEREKVDVYQCSRIDPVFIEDQRSNNRCGRLSEPRRQLSTWGRLPLNCRAARETSR
jgi:hypothetical protein